MSRNGYAWWGGGDPPSLVCEDSDTNKTKLAIQIETECAEYKHLVTNRQRINYFTQEFLHFADYLCSYLGIVCICLYTDVCVQFAIYKKHVKWNLEVWLLAD